MGRKSKGVPGSLGTKKLREWLDQGLDALRMAGWLRVKVRKDYPDLWEAISEEGKRPELTINSDLILRMKKDGVHVEFEKPLLEIFSEDHPLYANPTNFSTPSGKLIGRDQHLDAVDKAFHDGDISVFGIIAPGGVGKSKIIDTWLQDRMGAGGYYGARKIFIWSFYKQGFSGEAGQQFNSSTIFFEKALKFFGFEGDQPKNDAEKGNALAELLRQNRSLLVLDGLETLQMDRGRGYEIQDSGIYSLFVSLKHLGLGHGVGGLVLLSSRYSVIEMDGVGGYAAINLENLDNQGGAALLRSLGVDGKGLSDPLEDVSEEFGGHALTLVLLGNLLRTWGNDNLALVRSIDPIHDQEDSETDRNARHAKRILQTYEERWGEESNEVILMYLLGIFDRPVEQREKEALFTGLEFAKPLGDLPKRKLNTLARRLERANLIMVDGDRWDAHPVIRNYFGRRFQERHPEEWKQANRILFEHFQSIADYQPNTLEEMEPLYRAARHGCLAGDYSKSFKLFRERIDRNEEFYSGRTLGAYYLNLSLFAMFFPNGWDDEVGQGISKEDTLWLVGEAAFCMLTLGRISEAISRFVWRKNEVEQLGDENETVLSVMNAVNSQIPFGSLNDAKKISEESVLKTEKSDNNAHQRYSHVCLATVLHRLGRIKDSFDNFSKAEDLLDETPIKSKFLYFLEGSQYCSLLIDRQSSPREIELIIERATATKRIAVQSGRLMPVGMDNFILSRLHYLLGQYEKSERLMAEAKKIILKSGFSIFFPEVHYFLSTLFRTQKNMGSAKNALTEGLEVSQRCGMRLYIADGRLLEANLLLDEGRTEEGQASLNQARTMIEKMGYGQRFTEVHLAQARLAFQDSGRREAALHLKAAEDRIKEIGQWGLTGEVDAVRREIEKKVH